MSTKMKKIFNFTKKKRAFSPNTSDTGSVLSVGYDLKEKDLGKVHKAASTGDVAKLRQLAKKNDLNQLDKENRTALHIACVNGHTDVVQFLVESKAKLNLCDNQNRSALMKAVQCQQDRCIAVLLEHEADPNLVDINGNTALHLAARIPSPSIAVLLLEHEANINAQNKDGSTPLSLAVEENHPEMAELLLKECADVNMKNLEKRSPLMIAACNGQISMVRLLLDYNADISVKDDKGWSSDDYAVMNGHHACSHLIIEHGTKRRSLQSPSISNKRKQMSMLPSTGGMEATFMLGGPAIDKDGAEDNSHTESISRASKSGPADSWPSSDEDNELDLNPKKPQKVNLKTLLNASKKENKASGVEFLEQPSHSNPGEVSADEEDDESLEENESEGDEEEDDDEDDDDDDDEEEQDEDNDDEDEEEEDDDNDEEEGGDEDEESEESDEYNQEQKSGINIENIFQNVAAAVPEIDIQDTAPDRISVEEPLTQICPVVTQQIEKEESAHNSCGIAGNICLEEDCVVSAIRVQSRFSDEEECDGRISGPGSAMSPTPNICNAPQGNVTEGDSLENDDCNDDDDDWDDENDDELQIAEHLNLHNECERDIKSPDVYLPPKTPCLMAQEDKIDIFKHEDEEEGEHSDGTKKAECNQSPRPKLLYPENTFTGKTSQGDEVKKCDEDLETSSQEDSWGDEGDEAKTKPDEEEEGEVSDTGSPQHDYSVTVDKENTSFFHTNVPNVDKTEDNVAFSGESLHDDDMPVSMIVGHYECASKLSDKDGAEREEEYRKDKEDRKSVDSDSEVQEMHYDFASGTVRITREEQDDSENSMQLDEEGKNNEDGDCIACSSPKVSKSIFTMESNSNPESASQSPKRSRFQTRDSKGAQRDLNLTPLQYLDIELNKTPTPCPGSQELCSDDDDDRNDDISNVNKLQQCEPEPVGEEASDLETTLQQITKDIENPPNYLHDVDEEAEGLEIRMEERPVIDFRNTEDGPLQENDSMEDEEEEDEEQDEDDEEEDDEDETVEMEKIKEGEDTLLKTKSNQRDFLTELGLEKGDEEDDSPWDSESDCDSSRKQHCSGSSSPLKPHNIMTKISEENHEDLSYIPSFIRGTRNCNLETWGGIDRPGSKREKALCGDHFDGRPQEAAAEIQKSAASRREPMLVLNKLMETKEEVEKKTDLMEELGLADVDDLEDSSDWDSSSASSKINPPCSSEETRKLASSPALNSTLPTLMEQEQERPSSGEETEDPRLQTRPSPSGSALQPQPQPRTRRHIKAEDKEVESASSSQTDTDAEGETKQEGSVLNVSNQHHLPPLESKTQGEEECVEEGSQENTDVPWQKRYDKIWVESEKRETKSHYKNVAAELKEMFGELSENEAAEDIKEDTDANSMSATAEELNEEERAEEEDDENLYPQGRRDTEVDSSDCEMEDQVTRDFDDEKKGSLEVEVIIRTAAEESSDEEDEEVIVRPTARARRIGLMPILEQRESGQDESQSEGPSQSLEAAETQQNLPSTAPVLPNPEGSTGSEANSMDQSLVEERVSPQPGSEHDNHDFPTVQKTEGMETPTKYYSPYLKVSEVPCSLIELGSAAPHRLSDEELEEDMERFKNEAVGSAYRAVLDQDRNRALEDATRSSAFSGHDLERGEKSEMTLGNHRHKQEGSLRNPRDQASPTMDTVKRKHGSRSPSRTPTYREHHGYKDEERKMNALGSQEALLVPAMVQVGASQHEVHLNGDRLSVFDDSTLSEMSDDEGRSPSAVHKDMESQMELAIDFDNLTQSSDTPTEELDSPSSGYRHASVLIKQLDSTSIDSVSMVKLQNMFHEYERTIQRERSRYGRQADKLHQLEQERAELRLLLGETRDSQSNLEHCKVELETDINNLRFLLKQEQEKHRSASMLYEKTRDQLRRKEDQHQLEEEERQKLELSIRNLELEKRALINSIKQVEEDRNEIQRLLVQERSARSLQEEILNSHLRKQQEIEVENRKNLNKSNETLAQLTEASDREKELLQQVCGLQEELSVLRTELEHGRCHSKQEESRLSDENEMIRERLEDTRRDLKMSEEALAQTVFQYNGQLSTLKAECQVTASRLEQERATRQQLESEVESARSRLQVALQEVDRCQAVRAEADRALQREREERQRAQEKRAGEAGAHRDAVHDLSQQLSKAEARANSLENECHRTALALTEKGLLLEKTAHEREQALVRLRETEAALQVEREQVTRSGAKQEAMQERLAQAQSEAALLRQQLEEVQSKGVAKERAVSDAQERFSDIVAKLRSDSEERVMLVEERRQELANQNAELRKQNLQLEQDKAERETSVRQLQQELADSLKKLSMCEASLEVNTRYRTDLENEKTRTLQDMDRLKSKLQESEDQYVQAERRINSLKCSLDEKEREVVASAQKLQDVLSTSAATEKTVRQLEETVQRLEIENARLEAAAKQQSHRIEMLQKGAQEAAAPSDSSPGGGIRNRLEDLVTNLQSSKMTLEDQLSREVQKHSMLSHNAQDSQALWEEELKSRSKLSLRLSELEKEKGELTNQMEIEKKKAKKIAEHKKSVDARLAEEMKRNTELQKEMLRTLVKTAKKKLREQDCAEFGSPLSSLKGGMDLRHSEAEAAISRMKAKVDELQIQLDKEASRCSRLEEVNRDLKDQLSSLKGLSRSHERLERNKRQLEEEVLGLRRQMDAGVMDQNQADLYRRETEERARQEIRQKLEEVNLFLQTQAASQEALEQIKATNEASQRAELEQRIKDLERELGQARSTQHDSLVQRDSSLTELERYRQLYSEELRLRKSLTTKLERCNERLAEANTKLLTERQRSKSLITSTLVNGSLGGPSVEVGSLGSLGAYGSTLGPLNRSLGLGGSILGSVSDHQSNRIESYLAKMQSELEKNISKELDNATAGLDGGSPRLSPVGSAYGSQKSLTAEQDPVSRATQQYLEVLKKNYMI
ncbi:ankyrin repeat domain-containing protein 26 isoform X3 [Denticeps clupeoides]|uniref:ankyrin repeat domain-containing protein 26 isoform X3 n=1 Tax=Denticeps clupeoides TaxID=299321 RepID=UPI0010A569E1|nr:ankyrin repeat domain-containing protein 26-like isoform X3 [Denticeps clupeoides]